VASDGDLVGLICLDDIRRVPREKRPEETVAEAMTPYDRLVTVNPNEDLAVAVDRLGRGGYEQLPVVDQPHHMVGLLRRQDVINYLQVNADLGKEHPGPARKG